MMDLESFFSETLTAEEAKETANSPAPVVHKTTRKQVFVRDSENKIHLVDKRGKVVEGVQWDTPPKILSGAFIIGKSHGKMLLYTVLGEPVKNAEFDDVLVILNFWIVYIKHGVKYIARLEPNGMEFSLFSEMRIDDYGFLGCGGCAVNIDGEWIIFKHGAKSVTEDIIPSDVKLQNTHLDALVKQGFTVRYLQYLASVQSVHIDTANLDDVKLFARSNEELLDVLLRVTTVVGEYSPDEVGSMLGLNGYIITALKLYYRLKDLAALDI